MATTDRNIAVSGAKRNEVLAYLWSQASTRGSGRFVFVLGSEVCERFSLSPHTWRSWLDGWMRAKRLEYEAIHGTGTKIWLKGRAPCEISQRKPR